MAEPAPSQAAQCRGCGQPLPIAVRNRADRRDVCRICRKLSVATCTLCGTERLCRFAGMPHPICRYCVPERTRECAACGNRKRVAARLGAGLVCGDCARSAARGRPRCNHCHRAQLPAAWVDGAPLCSHCAGTKRPISSCAHCGEPRTGWRGQLCPPCALGDALDRLRAEGEPAAVARLAPFFDSLHHHAHPTTVIGWLARSRGAPVLRGMIAGEIAITHEALDEHDVGQATAYLRSWLVADKVLEPREELLARFERWAQRALDALGEHPDRSHLAAYARWKLSPDFARKLRRGQARASTPRAVYAKLRVAIGFTRSLHKDGLTLQQARQPHVDAWLVGRSSRAVATRAFLDWAHHAAITPRLHVPRTPPRTTHPPIDHSTRIELARSLLSNDDIERQQPLEDERRGNTMAPRGWRSSGPSRRFGCRRSWMPSTRLSWPHMCPRGRRTRARLAPDRHGSAHWRADGLEGWRLDALASHEIVHSNGQGGERRLRSQTDWYVEAPSRLQDLPQN